MQLPDRRRLHMSAVLDALRPPAMGRQAGGASADETQGTRRTGPAIPRWLPAVLGVTAVLALIVLGALLALRAISAVRHTFESSAHPAVMAPPAAGLLYSVTQGEQASSIVLGAAGSRTLAGGTGFAAALASPSGSQVVTLASPCPRCAPQYVLKDLAAGTERTIGTAPAAPPSSGYQIQAAWTRDGRQLAFVEYGLDAATPQIYALDLESGTRRALAPGDTQPQSFPAWSPDGKRLAYLSGTDSTIVDVIDLSSGSITIFNDQLDHASDLTWSPDGHSLALLHAGGIWLVSAADGHGTQVRVQGRVVALDGWSPDSRSLLALTEDTYKGAAGGTSIVVAPIDGSVPRVLNSGAPISSARWSPDGSAVAWVQQQDGRWTIWQAPVAGGAPTAKASGAGAATLTDWR